MEKKAKTQQPDREKRSSDSPSGKVAPKGKMGNSAANAEKKSQGNRSSTSEKKDSGSHVESTTKKPGSSSTTQRKGTGSGGKKDSNSKK